LFRIYDGDSAACAAAAAGSAAGFFRLLMMIVIRGMMSIGRIPFSGWWTMLERAGIALRADGKMIESDLVLPSPRHAQSARGEGSD